jgi:hypothetical protein
LVCVSKVDDTISGRAFMGLITGVVLSLTYKTPEYKKPTKYDWEKPDFNSKDKFYATFYEKFLFTVTEGGG